MTLFKRTFRLPSGETKDLIVRTSDGSVFMNSRWWDAAALKYLGIYEVTGNSARLGRQCSPAFGDATKYEGKFTASKSYRRSTKW